MLHLAKMLAKMYWERHTWPDSISAADLAQWAYSNNLCSYQEFLAIKALPDVFKKKNFVK